MNIWLFVCIVIVSSAFRKALTCSSSEVQRIATVLEEVDDWEKLANGLNMSRAAINSIKEYCITTTTVAECYRRELVETYCDTLSSGDPHRVASDITLVLENEMGKEKQAQILRRLFPTVCRDYGRENFYSTAAVSDSLCTVSSRALSHYADYLRGVYSTSPVAKSDKFPPTSSKVFIKLALVKKGWLSREEADAFTRLTLQGDVDQILQAKEPIEMDDILREDDKGRLVVVEGAPGIGKTTLAWELCRQWPTLESLKKFSLVVLLRLREEGVQSATDISDLFPCADDPGLSSLVAQEVKHQNGNGVLFVLDGFDEFPHNLRASLDSTVMKVMAGKLFPKATVLVTSRHSAIADLWSVFQTSISKRIEIVGFSGTEIQSYAKSIFGNNSKILASFTSYLSANPVVKRMMYNPLNCVIVVGIYQYTHKSGKPVPHTQTQLYTTLTLCLLSRHLSAAGDPFAEKLPKKLEDLPHDSDLYQQLVKVGQLAFEGKQREEVIFTQLPEGCSNLGLLVEYRALYIQEETSTYSFFHLTLQEYMSAFYISQLQDSEQRALFIDHFSLMKVVWRFVAGLTKMETIGWDEVRRMEMKGYIYLEEENTVHVGLFTIQCVYETQDPQSCEGAIGQHHVIPSQPVEVSDLFALGYCVSTCSNAWKVQLGGTQRDLDHDLEMFSQGLKTAKYGGGTIERLDIIFSRGVMSKREHLLQIPLQILQPVKSLNFKWCDIDQRGFENLAECIPYLHSLTSLDISDNPGGDGSLVKLLRALREHGKLQELGMHHIAIGVDDVAALADLVQSSSSLRKLMVSNRARSQTSDVEQQLVKTVLSSTSLETVWIRTNRIHPLEHFETISDTITSLTLISVDYCNNLLPKSTMAKGGTKLSYILRKNTSFKKLELLIPLNEDELHNILSSLKDNHSLERLTLSTEYHCQYFPMSEQATMDPRIIFQNDVSPTPNLYNL